MAKSIYYVRNFLKLSKDGFPLSRNVYVRTQVKFTGVNSTEDDYEYEIELKVCSRNLEEYSTRKASLYYFSPEKLVLLFLLKKV